MPEKQEYLFQSRCGACHTIGQGDRVGPDLAGVTTRRDRTWLARYLAEPDRVRAEGDPIDTTTFRCRTCACPASRWLVCCRIWRHTPPLVRSRGRRPRLFARRHRRAPG